MTVHGKRFLRGIGASLVLFAGLATAQTGSTEITGLVTDAKPLFRAPK